MKEIWKDIEGYEGIYQVSNLGNIYSIKRSKIKSIRQIKGYSMVNLCNNYKERLTSVHRLIAIHFIPNIENKSQINHINGIKNDNRIENLEWCTSKENIHHAHKLGLKNKNRKLTSDDVLNLRKDHINNISNKDLSIKYNIHIRTVSKIIRKLLWSYI